MEIQRLLLPENHIANVREIEVGLYRKKGSLAHSDPLHVLMYEFTKQPQQNIRQDFTIPEINYIANTLNRDVHSTIMTPDYKVEFQIGNYSSTTTTTNKFLVKSDTDINIAQQAVHDYLLQQQGDASELTNRLMGNKFYITMYFTNIHDRKIGNSLNPPGGANDDGKCFWQCLESKFPKLCSLPSLTEIFKGTEFVELKPVKISDIPKIESALKITINVLSEVRNVDSYKSKHKYYRGVNLVFIEIDKGYHYELLSTKCKGEGNTERIFDEQPVIIFNNKEYYNGTKIMEIKNKSPRGHKIRLIDFERIFLNKESKNEILKPTNWKQLSIEEKLKKAYELYTNAISKIKEWSKGKFNLFKFKNINSFIRMTFYESIKNCLHQSEMEKVKEYELEPLEESSKGALMILKSRTEQYENGYQYDMKSSYPYTMIHKKFRFPIKKGTFRTVKQEWLDKDLQGKSLSYGLYHCKVVSKPKGTFFTQGKYEWFTHWDLHCGYEQGIRFEIINEVNNCMYWLKDGLVDGDTIFRNYIMYFYKPKNDTKCPLVKRLLSGLWGALIQTKSKTEIVKIVNDKIEYTLKKGYVFDSMIMSGNDEAEIEVYKPSLYYSSYARLKPFLLSFQRKLMYDEVIKPIKDTHKIIRVMNDSIIIDKRIEEYDNNKNLKVQIFDSNTIGKMVFEKEYHNFKTLNLHKFEF